MRCENESRRVRDVVAVQFFAARRAMRAEISLGLGLEHRTPDFGRSCPSGSKFAQCKLTLPNAMHEFDAGDGDRRMLESLETEHRSQTKLDGSVFLFNEIVQVFRRSNSRPCAPRVCARSSRAARCDA